jgi:hypothetical protein
MKRLMLMLMLSGCPQAESEDAEGCEHLRAGPATEVTAAASTAGAPAVKDDHRRYDISLQGTSAGGGRVSFAPSEAGDYAIYLGAAVPLTVQDSSGNAVAFEESVSSSATCAEVKARHVVPLSVGTYFLLFGQTSEAKVSVVIEPFEHAH